MANTSVRGGTMFSWLLKKGVAKLNLSVPIQEARKRARILVIDDEDTFPTELMVKEGYNVVHWTKVESLRPLEEGEYDIIFLDIYDVAKEISQQDGLGVLEHLKRYNPSQIIIAYSGRSFDLNMNRFWKLADDTLAKPSDLVTCKESIDRILEEKFSPNYYMESLIKLLKENGASDKDISSVKKTIIHAIDGKHGLPDIRVKFNHIFKDTELVLRAVAISHTILRITGAIK